MDASLNTFIADNTGQPVADDNAAFAELDAFTAKHKPSSYSVRGNQEEAEATIAIYAHGGHIAIRRAATSAAAIRAAIRAAEGRE